LLLEEGASEELAALASESLLVHEAYRPKTFNFEQLKYLLHLDYLFVKQLFENLLDLSVEAIRCRLVTLLKFRVLQPNLFNQTLSKLALLFGGSLLLLMIDLHSGSIFVALVV